MKKSTYRHGEHPTGCGIRVGDTVTYKGPGGESARVAKVDYTTHLAYVEWKHGSTWNTFDSLWVEAETVDA